MKNILLFFELTNYVNFNYHDKKIFRLYLKKKI